MLGALLFLILVGEPTVGYNSGLFTLPGLVVLSLLYLLYFWLVDALVTRYNFSNLQLVLVNFALYAVLITGLLHGELADYVLHPHNNLITTLIRLQSSLYPLFAYALLRRISPQSPPGASLWKAALGFGLFVVVLSPTRQFGLGRLALTFIQAPFAANLYGVLAILALVAAWHLRKPRRAPTAYTPTFIAWSVLLLVFGCLPALPAFLALLVLSLGVGLFYLARPNFRNTAASA